jgi:hypothetical protein
LLGGAKIIVSADAPATFSPLPWRTPSQLLRGSLRAATRRKGEPMIALAITAAVNLQGIVTDVLSTVTGLLGGVTGAL